jgi:hypothetical protein
VVSDRTGAASGARCAAPATERTSFGSSLFTARHLSSRTRLASMFAGGTGYYYQTHLNKVWTAATSPPTSDSGTEVVDIGAERFRDAEPVDHQQTDQRAFGGGAEPGRDQWRADFVTVQPNHVRLASFQ